MSSSSPSASGPSTATDTPSASNPTTASDAPASPRAPASAPRSASTAEIQQLFEAQRAHRPVVRGYGAEERVARIRRLRETLIARRDAIQEALWADFRKAPVEVDLSELTVLTEEARHAERHVAEWMTPTPVPSSSLLAGTRSEIRYEPKGVVLIMAPWNYPINLTLSPLIAALAAGNSVIIKPSEYTTHTSRLMRTLIQELYEEREVALVEGGKDVAQDLLDLPFDHIYFTGSPTVGKIVMRSAAEHLTSVTLELGGKSPAVVHRSADVADAARKIAWGKFTNAGQTCIAPDYVLADQAVYDQLLDELQASVRRFYGASKAARRASDDYARLIHERHFDHVQKLFEASVQAGARVVMGGDADAKARYFAPTLLADVPSDAAVMQEEIFGPLLPVLPVESLDGTVAAIERYDDTPLALYVFSQDESAVERLLQETRAGGTCVNDVLSHYLNVHLPFGGLRTSGIGRGHGVHGFRAFSNERAVLRRHAGSSLVQALYPPYTGFKERVVDFFLRYWS